MLTAFAGDDAYKALLKNALAQQTQQINNMYAYSPQSTKEKKYKEFPSYTQLELDTYLKKQFGALYDGYHPLIDEYIDFFTSQPTVNYRVLFGLYEQLKKENEPFAESTPSWMPYLLLSRIHLMPVTSDKNNFYSVGLNAMVALNYGVELNEYVDDRVNFSALIEGTTLYFQVLQQKFEHPSEQLSALMLGASTVRKANGSAPEATTYWERYAHLQHRDRDFYPALLAIAFIHHRREAWGVKGYTFQPKWETTTVVTDDTLHFEQVAAVLELNLPTLRLMNARYFSQVVPPGATILIPSEKEMSYALLKDSIYAHQRANYFPNPHDSCYVFYRTERGEYFRDLTHWFGPSLHEIKQLNGFTSNTLPKRWDVFFKVPCSDSAYFAQFESMSRSQRDAAARGEKVTAESPNPDTPREEPRTNTPTEKPSGKKITYTVKSGDTLWGIGQKYKVNDSDIMKWNNIGTNIQPGQKLTIYLP
jgi:membrane-bound lytic murein transglycosylase D